VKPTERFSDRVRDYARYRPRYPAAVLDILRREIGLTPEWVVADVGSGTGISAEIFLDHGNLVIGVEPNPAMRAHAERHLAGRAGFRSVAATAESTSLAASSVDLVLAAQAFHWFDPLAARREFGRILRPPGHVALVWNTRRTHGTPFLQAYERLLMKHGTDYVQVRHDHVDARRLDPLFDGRYVRHYVRNEQRLDRDGLVGRVLSSSYTPKEDDPRRPPMVRELDRLFRKHAAHGEVTLVYETEVYLGTVAY
jgi:SAM-dependent methyltransferase